RTERRIARWLMCGNIISRRRARNRSSASYRRATGPMVDIADYPSHWFARMSEDRDAEVWRDSRWARAVKTGDRRAFDTIMRRLGPPLCAFARRYCPSDDAAAEIVQDVFVALWINRARIDIRTSIRTYLFGAVRNRALNAARDAATARAFTARLA